MISVKNINFSYNKCMKILTDISLDIGYGEIVNLLGPNGCGKSTLLKCILGFQNVDSGNIFLDGKNIKHLNRVSMAKKLAYVPQLHNGLFSYSVLDVVLMGRVAFAPWYNFAKSDYTIAYEALEKVRLTKYAKRSYLHLSGGERQLVLIARALSQQADLCIMDEPVTGLDYGNQYNLLQIIKDLRKEGVSFLLTTHHPEHAVFLGGRAVLLKHGKIIADGDSEEVITSECVCNLYNMPKDMLSKISQIYMRRDK